jgi:prevent-host-death family protein
MNSTVSVSKFKAECLKIIDHVQSQGDVIVITKYGHPAAKLVPIDSPSTETWFGRGAGTVREKGDLYSTGEVWDADS